MLRRKTNLLRLVATAFVATVIYFAVAIWMPFRLQKDIASRLRAQGARVIFLWREPYWLPGSVQELRRTIYEIDLEHKLVSADSLQDLRWLYTLEVLDANHSGITDADFEHFQGLTSLRELIVDFNEIGDPGLELLSHPSEAIIGNQSVTDV